MVYQLGSAMTDAFVLAIVSRGDTYGYLISQMIKPIVNLKESTLYPVLKRLLEAGFLESYDMPFQGRNRRYYRITELGMEKHKYYLEEWEIYKKDVEHVLRGGSDGNE